MKKIRRRQVPSWLAILEAGINLACAETDAMAQAARDGIAWGALTVEQQRQRVNAQRARAYFAGLRKAA